MVLRAPAKINWFLRVAGRRDDGYHEIASVMQKVTLYDTLTFEAAEDLELVSDLDLPVRENLVYRAALLLREYSGCPAGARITLRKNIPSMAGLGGGSSDAAAALIGLNDLWGLGLDGSRLQELGSRLGSDVPFFIGPPLAFIQGRGELVSPLRSTRPFALLLVKPDVSISTGWAYRQYRKLTKKTVDITLFCQALDAGDFITLRQLLFNDLEDAVIPEYRVIAETRDKLLRHGAEIALMSGSGSAVFGVFRTSGDAHRAAEAFAGAWLCVVETIVGE